MGYLDVIGHEDLRLRLARAALTQRLPQSLLFHGPRGIGKQRLALWTAGALTCGGEAPKPCGTCLSCRLAARLEHPDIHWFFPMPRPKGASGAEQLRNKLEDQRHAILEDRRANPHYLDEQESASGIYVGAAQTMRRLAQKAPAMSPYKVFVIGRAEALVPQAASPEAANALLKLLEEPPADTFLILTAEAPGALLSTIRSRVQAMRVAPLPIERVRGFLESELGLAGQSAQRVASLSGGSIGSAIELAGDEFDRQRASALELAAALFDDRASTRLAVAHRYPSFGGRGSFGRVLRETASLLRDLLADAAGAAGAVSDSEAIAALRRGTETTPQRIILALAAVARAQELAERNVNPQLIVVNLLRRANVIAAGSVAGPPAVEKG